MKDLGLVLLILAMTAGELFAQAAVSPRQSFAAAKTGKSAAHKEKTPPNNLFAPETKGKPLPD